ncbi:MAG: spermidine synthase [Deltaproteobacteria bacterium]|nr:MAG: spermidine synthase [Deltaproteobacteria bacterium]
MSRQYFQRVSLYVLIFLSGLAGLGYEMVWSRMLTTGLGHEITAVLAVVAAFFCGMALGAWSLDKRVSSSRTPGRWYAGLELVVGVWAVALVFLIPWSSGFAAKLTGPEPSPLIHWTVAFVLPFFLLLPATYAMGGTLPAMERLFSHLRQDGRCVGGLYAANTFGGVAGTLVTTFFIAPAWGFQTTLFILAAVNVVCAAGVLNLARQEARPEPVEVSLRDLPSPRRLYAILFFTGLLGIGYEVMVVRILSQVLENTIFSFASILSVYLLGTACGAALYQRMASRLKYEPTLTYLLQAVSTACLIGVMFLWRAEPVYDAVRTCLGGGFFGSIAGELVLSAFIFLLPTVLMGGTFSHLAQAARRQNGGFGRALGINTVGAAFSPLVFGVLLLPSLGAKLSLTLVSIGYLFCLAPAGLKKALLVGVPLLLCVAILFGFGPMHLVTVPPGAKIAAHVEGVMAAVSVIESADGEFHLKVNNHFVMGGTASYYSDRRQGHIPLLLHPHPKRALFLGLGTGATFAAAADHPLLEAEGVELIPEIIPLLRYFVKSTEVFSQYPGLHLKVADARRFVNASRNKYDVIVADLFHPARDGAGSLYTVEHFQAIRGLLEPGGLFCQWLPLYQLDLDVLRIIVRTFLQVFPEGTAYLSHYSLQTPIIGLIGTTQPGRYPPEWLDHRIHDATLRGKLHSLRLNDSYALFGNFLAGREDLAVFAGAGPLNTDDHPVITFAAPRFIYTWPQPASGRLISLINTFKPQPEQLLESPHNVVEAAVAERLTSYWQARNQFLLAGIGITPTNDPRQLLKSVREPLLSVVRLSHDFAPAYDPLLILARRLYPIDPYQSRALLLDLENANPVRDDARSLREHLFN